MITTQITYIPLLSVNNQVVPWSVWWKSIHGSFSCISNDQQRWMHELTCRKIPSKDQNLQPSRSLLVVDKVVTWKDPRTGPCRHEFPCSTYYNETALLRHVPCSCKPINLIVSFWYVHLQRIHELLTCIIEEMSHRHQWVSHKDRDDV